MNVTAMRVFVTLFAAFFILSFHVQAQKKKTPKKDQVVTISTSFGDMVLILYDQTPKHKENFLKLVDEKFYDGTAFHRVIKEFMIQGGDPLSKEGEDSDKAGTGGPGYTVPAEFVDGILHTKGALAAARQGDQMNPEKASSGSQFYIVHNPDRCRHLNGEYTVYGQVIQGLEVVDKIASQPVVRGSKPKEDIRMTMTSQKMKRKKVTEIYGYEYPES